MRSAFFVRQLLLHNNLSAACDKDSFMEAGHLSPLLSRGKSLLYFFVPLACFSLLSHFPELGGQMHFDASYSSKMSHLAKLCC